MTMGRVGLLLLALVKLAALPALAQTQSPTEAATSSRPVAKTPAIELDQPYTRPTEKTRLHSYLFDTFGPYPIVGAALAAGINQADNTPPEWRQGAEGYGKRFASDFAIAGVSTTTRYALAAAFREDTLYYRCACKGVLPRLQHALVSTFVSHRGADGHRVFSFPALVAPYAGTMTAVYVWYPGRYNAMDGFRMGNYSLLGYMGGNVAIEFLYRGPHSFLSRLHLNNGHAAPTQDSQP